MIAKIGEALKIFITNAGLFLKIILTVWIPANILIVLLDHYVIPAGNYNLSMNLNKSMETLLSPICVAAMIYALSRIKQNQSVDYSEAMKFAFNNWGRLIAARFIAGLYILLGCLLLIVPGIIWAIRYTLVDSIALLEDSKVTEVRHRSTILTEGKRWQIFFLFLFYIIFAIIVLLILFLPLGILEGMKLIPEFLSMFITVILDCITDIILSIMTVIMFLYYWEAKEEENRLGDNREIYNMVQ